MTITLVFLLVAAIAAPLTCSFGAWAMASGGGTIANAERQQNSMRKRVLYQAVAIMLVALLLTVAGGSTS